MRTENYDSIADMIDDDYRSDMVMTFSGYKLF